MKKTLPKILTDKSFKPILIIGAILSILIALFIIFNKTQRPKENELVSFSDYKAIVNEVEAHRADRLVDFKSFLEMSKKEGTIILDTRSDEMYARRHLKGAVHLDFTNFTQDNLAKVIPSNTTNILIYCNNNFSNDPINFATKSYIPLDDNSKRITLALNIPTYINLYGYGYKNIYELSELLSINDPRVQFEGTDVLVR